MKSAKEIFQIVTTTLLGATCLAATTYIPTSNNDISPISTRLLATLIIGGLVGGWIGILHIRTVKAQRLAAHKEQLLGKAVHDLKTPITAINGYSELLLNQHACTTEQQHEFLTYINEKGWELDAMLDTLREINRPAAQLGNTKQ